MQQDGDLFEIIKLDKPDDDEALIAYEETFELTEEHCWIRHQVGLKYGVGPLGWFYQVAWGRMVTVRALRITKEAVPFVAFIDEEIQRLEHEKKLKALRERNRRETRRAST